MRGELTVLPLLQPASTPASRFLARFRRLAATNILDSIESSTLAREALEYISCRYARRISMVVIPRLRAGRKGGMPS